jgi:YD repeat-containing protein
MPRRLRVGVGVRSRPWAGPLVCALTLQLAACAGDDDAPPDGDEDAGEATDAGDAGEPGGQCVITWQQDRSQVRASMSDDGREVSVVFADHTEHHRFDERGLWVHQEFVGGPARAPADFTYDAQGHLISATAFATPGESCTNDYDAEDRLVRHACSQSTHAYRHDDAGRIDQVTLTLSDGRTLVSEVRYDGGGQRPVALEDDDSLYTYAYDADDRMTESQRDWVFGGGKDGTFDVRWSWQRRSDGGVGVYAQDGTDHNDAPVIDGVPDLSWTFSAGCDALGLAHPWLTGEPTVIDVGQPRPPFPF